MWIYNSPAVLNDPEAGGAHHSQLAERLLENRPHDPLFLDMRAVSIRTIERGVSSTPLRTSGSVRVHVRWVRTHALVLDSSASVIVFMS
jgi:hypothetical protein